MRDKPGETGIERSVMRRQPGDRDEMSQGYVEYGLNELSIVATVADPPAVRLAARSGGGLGKISFNRLRPDGLHEEVVLLQGKLDERTPNMLAGEVTLHLRRPGVDGDGAMVAVATLRHDGVTFHVPVNGASSAAGGSSSIVSDDNHYVCQMQGDGNLVVCKDGVPTWSIFTGRIG